MGYKLSIVCDSCGVEYRVPLDNIRQLAEATYPLIARLKQANDLNVPDDTALVIHCARCAVTVGAPSGMERVPEIPKLEDVKLPPKPDDN